MGNLTIIEFNHDQTGEIFETEESQKLFLRQLHQQFAAFTHNHSYILGGKVLAGFHRSGRTYDLWTKFKKKMGWQ